MTRSIGKVGMQAFEPAQRRSPERASWSEAEFCGGMGSTVPPIEWLRRASLTPATGSLENWMQTFTTSLSARCLLHVLPHMQDDAAAKVEAALMSPTVVAPSV
jgi:hypothetical protein